MNDDMSYVGIVKKNGELTILNPAMPPGFTFRLTESPMQAGHGPEVREIDLSAYAGRAIMVSGNLSGGWIWSAHIVDEAGPMLSAVVLKVFGAQEITF